MRPEPIIGKDELMVIGSFALLYLIVGFFAACASWAILYGDEPRTEGEHFEFLGVLTIWPLFVVLIALVGISDLGAVVVRRMVR